MRIDIWTDASFRHDLGIGSAAFACCIRPISIDAEGYGIKGARIISPSSCDTCVKAEHAAMRMGMHAILELLQRDPRLVVQEVNLCYDCIAAAQLFAKHDLAKFKAMLGAQAALWLVKVKSKQNAGNLRADGYARALLRDFIASSSLLSANRTKCIS